MNILNKDGYRWVLYLAILVIVRITDFDIFLFCVLLGCCALLFVLSVSSNHKGLLRFFTFFLLLHLIIFPLVYLAILKYDQNAIIFDESISIEEQEEYLIELKNLYEPEKIDKQIQLIDSILIEDSKSLSTKLTNVDSFNIVSTDKYLMNKFPVSVRAKRPTYLSSFNFYDKDGKLLFQLKGKELVKMDNRENSIKDYLIAQKEYFEETYHQYLDNTLMAKKENGFWSYSRILPYSLNISFTDNMSPKSKLSNVVFFVHQLIVFTFILGVIGGLIQNLYIIRMGKKNDNDKLDENSKIEDKGIEIENNANNEDQNKKTKPN